MAAVSEAGEPLLLEGGSDLGERIVHFVAEEGQDQDNHDSDQHQDKCVLNEALAFLLELLELLAHVVSPPFIEDSMPAVSAGRALVRGTDYMNNQCLITLPRTVKSNDSGANSQYVILSNIDFSHLQCIND